MYYWVIYTAAGSSKHIRIGDFAALHVEKQAGGRGEDDG